MSPSPPPAPLPDRAAELRLHVRLLAGDRTASADLAVAYFDYLVEWLAARNHPSTIEFCDQAAGLALTTLIKAPASYQPERGSTLLAFLHMSAQGDLRNLLAKEGRHRRGRKSLEDVEVSPVAGKYLGRNDDPALPLLIAEEEQAAVASVPEDVQHSMTPQEAAVLRLMRQGVKKSSILAEAYGLGHLPPKEQQKEMNKVKNRLKQRVKRARSK